MSTISVDRSPGALANRARSRLGLALLVMATSCAAPSSDTIIGVSMVRSAAPAREPLASWIDGPSKRAIVDFVMRVSASGSTSAIPEPDRIAMIDNNGTLWPAKPLPEAAFVAARLRAKAMEKAMLRNQPSYSAIMNEGVDGLGAMVWRRCSPRSRRRMPA